MPIRPHHGRCTYCKAPFNTDDPDSTRYPTKDHALPRSRGGKGGRNIVWACQRCNGEKGAMTPAEYRAFLRGDHLQARA